MNRPDPRPEISQAEAPKKPFGSRSLARLAEISSQFPSQLSLDAAGAPTETVDPKSPLARALAARIVISRDSRGRGGKTVTFARGIVAPSALFEELARELRHELGTGVRVEEGALIVQGALTERLAAALAKRGAARIVIGN